MFGQHEFVNGSTEAGMKGKGLRRHHQGWPPIRSSHPALDQVIEARRAVSGLRGLGAVFAGVGVAEEFAGVADGLESGRIGVVAFFREDVIG
jgi:hypothetical protein